MGIEWGFVCLFVCLGGGASFSNPIRSLDSQLIIELDCYIKSYSKRLQRDFRK